MNKPIDTGTAAGAAVRLDGLCRSYGVFKAVDNVSLRAEAGEFLALLGPSGSGKTTLLMMIAGFDLPDSGQIHIGEDDVTHLPANKRNIGVVFQNYALFPHMSVSDNIAFPLLQRKLPRDVIASKVEAAISLVRLEGHADKLPGALSGGQQQRVAIARATVFDPRLILMDEPLGALDRRLREDMQFEIKELQRRLAVTIIYVTHDQEEALVMADRIAVLRNARLEQVGSPEMIYDRPANAFVADFVGQTNFIKARVQAIGDGRIALAMTTGQVLEVAKPDGFVGDRQNEVLVAIRPERMRFGPAEAPGLRGRLRQSFYAGGVRLSAVEIEGGGTIRIRAPSDFTDAGPTIGDLVNVCWDDRYVQLFKP